MTTYLSNKFRNLSAVSILMVLYIHMYYTEGETMQSLGLFESVIGKGLCLVAVPLFYLISGYLFFMKVPNGYYSIFGKLKKRIRTLLVPYILANTLTFLFYVVLNLLIYKVPLIGGVINFRIIDDVVSEGILPTLNLVYIDPPVAFQLWFIRDLMVVMLLSPIVYWMFTHFNKFGGIISLLLIVLFICYGGNGYISAFVWFYSGGCIAFFRVPIEFETKNRLIALLLCSIYVCSTLTITFNWIPDNLNRYIPFIGIPALWLTYDAIIDKNISISCNQFVGYTFFVYLIHEPLLNIFKKIPLIINRSEPMLIICYITIPVLFYIFACILGKFMKKYLPNAYNIYTGGR